MSSHYYLELGREGLGHAGEVVSILVSDFQLKTEGINVAPLLEIPGQPPFLLNHRYLGEQVSGITVLGSDYLSLFEAPPTPDHHWDGKEWVSTEVAEPQV
jgi:hypothetical protein